MGLGLGLGLRARVSVSLQPVESEYEDAQPGVQRAEVGAEPRACSR